jgi:hypothetical protein
MMFLMFFWGILGGFLIGFSGMFIWLGIFPFKITVPALLKTSVVKRERKNVCVSECA